MWRIVGSIWLVGVIAAILCAGPAGEDATAAPDAVSRAGTSAPAAAVTAALHRCRSSSYRRRHPRLCRRYNEDSAGGGSGSSGMGARTSRGGGLGLFAPWPYGQVLMAGGACGGNYVKERAHSDYHGRWTDDRYAVDFGLCGDADLGMDVLAAHEGTVRVAKYDSGYGLTVVVERKKNADASRYAHLDRIQAGIRPGVRVAAGQRLGTIGHSGASGPASNAHLHYARYRSRARSAGIEITSMAGVDLCDGCLIESLTPYAAPGATPFIGSLVDIRPGETVEADAGKFTQLVVEIKFNQPFDPAHFVLRPVTEETRRFTSSGDVRGKPSGDGNAAVYTIPIGTGDTTAAADYGLRWDLVNALTEQGGNVRVSVTLRVGTPRHRREPCPPPESDTGDEETSSSFKATLDAEFPMDAAGRIWANRESEIKFGFNIRFNKAFESNFVLRPSTWLSVGTFVPPFGTLANDFPGEPAPNDAYVGYYRAVVRVPDCVPDGTYPVRWGVFDRRTSEFGGLEPGFVLVVSSRPPGAAPAG
jgi:hypothetical protein